ncbi:DUF3644 domain-containing protein [Rhizobium leguminosarum]|uniref:DUF3644 domain-containing protein n=1 Tax=Rhizobium leguminosarum TaxID=384 RepID=A0A7X0A033_RHILE|nr:DUF3644 domain-containing protein [Rhizobium leguminosarum]MBB6225293.1 hypothetical protein [Rhizobium leguminosarum]
MPKKLRIPPLERWEIALVKGMLARGGYSDQMILAYFTRPTRSVNHRVISEIRTEAKHKAVKAASDDDLGDFLATWPDVEQETGLSIRGDELLIKAREAMIAAVHVFNGAGLTFRAELFIVTSVIAWTYLLHAFYRGMGVDYRHKNNDGTIKTTAQGEDCYWELGMCLRQANCPIPSGAIKNLEFLLMIRHEIEHRMTNRIDDAVSAKLQACCINFNDAIKKLFGAQYALERRLPIALQFVTFSSDQRSILKKASSLPPHITTALDEFHQGLTDEQLADPDFAYRVVFVPKLANRKSSADLAIEFVKPGSEEANEINRVLLKEVEKKRYLAKQIVMMMQEEGYPKFTLGSHAALWRALDAKNLALNFGRDGEYKGMWVWYESWLQRVRAHCQENAERYQE